MKVHDSNPPLTKYIKESDLMFYWEFRGQLHIFIISDISAFSISTFMLVLHEEVISRKGGIKWGDLAGVKIHPKLVSLLFFFFFEIITHMHTMWHFPTWFFMRVGNPPAPSPKQNRDWLNLLFGISWSVALFHHIWYIRVLQNQFYAGTLWRAIRQ